MTIQEYLDMSTKKQRGRIERALSVMYNERKCVASQYDGSCNNKRDCENCTLALDKDEILKAYDFVIGKLNDLKENKNE